MIKLRDYQQQAVDGIRESYRRGKKSPLLVLPTGGGKTTIFAYITTEAAKRGNVVFLLCHRAELVKQISMTLGAFGQEHQVIAPTAIVNQTRVAHFAAYGRSLIQASTVYVASVQTLINKIDGLHHKPSLIVIDEAHHLTRESTWGRIIAAYPDARLLPVTATPCRLDGKGLGIAHAGYADDIIIGQTMSALIESSHLCDYRAYCPPSALDLSSVKTTAGDYNKGQLADAMDKPTITGDAVKHYHRLLSGKRAVVFCVSVAHAEHVAESFTLTGVRAESLDGTLSPDERAARIRRFTDGTTLVLTSCDVISEGFDLPAIEAAILLRPTKSLSLYLQQVGRALRPFPGKKEAVILDHVGALSRHGLPDSDREWTLDGAKKRGRKSGTDEPDVNIKTCPACYHVFESKLPACPACGLAVKVQAREIEQVDGQLEEIDKAAMRQQKKQEERKCTDHASLAALGRSRGYKYPEQWATRMIEIRSNYAKR
jgi:superfamily II DNA or RNA helicase